MVSEAISLAASHKILSLAAAGGLALSAVFAGSGGWSRDGDALPPPILIEADLGSLLRVSTDRAATTDVTVEAAATPVIEPTVEPDVNLTVDAGGVLGIALR